MSLTPQEELERRILATVELHSAHSMKFRALKPIVVRLVSAKMLERHTAVGSKVPLMLAITHKGRTRLAELRWKRTA